MSHTVSNEAIERLLAGNRRFVTGGRLYPDQSPAYRRLLTVGQHPFAAILGCADSRIPIEIIFDQGLGNLFSVRVAGHVLDHAVIGSLEYAVEHLGVPLIVVLGHSGCGCVRAALAGGHAPGQMSMLLAAIQPAIKQASAGQGDVEDQVVRIHTASVVHQLSSAAPILAPLVEAGSLQILGAHYDLASGVVEMI